MDRSDIVKVFLLHQTLNVLKCIGVVLFDVEGYLAQFLLNTRANFVNFSKFQSNYVETLFYIYNNFFLQ